MPDKINDKITDEQTQWLVSFIEREKAREEEDRAARDRLVRIREAILEKIAAGSVWALISLAAIKITKRYFD